MASSEDSSSSSSVPTRGWTYDVFLSFRGEDTRNTIVDHLYSGLNQRGMRVYKDNIDLQKGEAISPQLLKAIEESRFAVVVFSKNYGNSGWCLDELAKIKECQDKKGQKVLPLFYHVEPTDVRRQKGDFATEFEKHDHKFKEELEKVKNWRDALAAIANLTGWHISANSGGEASYVNEIVQKISEDVPAHVWDNNLIGIESRIDALYSLLKREATKEVRMVGIYGMGGMGKTTIAQALFKRISKRFDGSSFVKNVRENSSCEKDICALQQKILGDILRTQIGVQDREQGAKLIEERLCNKKVLLVLDDVDDVDQLEALAARHEWFGVGSRIIITTRDEHLLSNTNAKFKPSLLLMNEAVELFSRHAFGGNSPPEGYDELSNRAIRYTGRLPLAVKVLGSFFHGRKVGVWEDALDRLAESPNRKIFDTLKLSFDGLEDSEKNIFLDIACLFKGELVEDVIIRLDCCGFHPKIGIDVLLKKSLISVSYKRLQMHDLLQEMALHIVRKSFPNSRLCVYKKGEDEETHDFIKKNRKLKAVEAIKSYRYFSEDENMMFNPRVFESMNNLRLLEVARMFTFLKPTVLPDSLRWLYWEWYPFSSLPLSDMCKLVGLMMEFCSLKHLWKGQKVMQNLKFIHLHRARSLTRFPDVSGAPNIERLVLSTCMNLEEVDESVGSLKRLVYLDMRFCSNLKRLPSRIEMESLETLILKWCYSLKRFPEVSPCMVKLSHIDLEYCHRIEELPSSVRYLSSLRLLDLSSCTKLNKWAEECGSMENLLELQPGSMAYKFNRSFERIGLPINFHSLTQLFSLRTLDLSGIHIREEDFPNNHDAFQALEVLGLGGNPKLLQLPAGISHLSSLIHLRISECRNLQNVHGLPSGLQVLDASSLEKIEDLSKDHEWLFKISLLNCHKLLKNETYLDNMLQESIRKCAAVDHSLSMRIPGSKIPSWFKQHEHGGQIVLKLPQKWETGIIGFAICGVFRKDITYWVPSVLFRFEDGGMLVPELDDEDSINASASAAAENENENENMCISYIPFSLFQQQMDDGDDHDYFQRGDVSHIIEANLHINISMGSYPEKAATRCGAHVVYKEDVEFIQQIIPSFSSYWNWKLSHKSPYRMEFKDEYLFFK